MLVAERHREIIAAINERGSMRVTELAQLFQVTEETIRRDLEKLEAQGKLLRSHGGAISKEKMERETPFKERQIANVAEKSAIAREAVKRVEANDTIMLDASTTAWEMAKLLPDIQLTVVTNAIKVAVELADRSRVTVISTGGTLSPESLSYVGPLAERSLEGYHVNKLFFSCKGFNLETGLSDPTEWQAMLKRRMISIADQCYVLVDHSKFGVQALATFADVTRVHEVITDDKVDPSVLNRIEGMGLTVKVAR